MPLYTYRCKTCEHQFEVRQKYTDDALTSCPQPDCKGELRKVINQVGVVFKGSGFYVNDAKAKNPAAPSTNGKSEGSGSDSGSTESGKSGESGSGESSGQKAETKSETKTAASSSSGDNGSSD